MSSTRNLFTSLAKTGLSACQSAQNAVEAYIFGQMAYGEVRKDLFALFGYLALGKYAIDTFANLMTTKKNTQEIAASAFDIAVQTAITTQLALAVKVIPVDVTGAPNQFIWATTMGLIYMGSKMGAKLGAMSPEEFQKALTEMKENKTFSTLKLAHAIMPFLKGLGIIVFLSKDPAVGQAIVNAEENQISPIDEGMMFSIAGICAEQAVIYFKDVVQEAVKMYREARPRIEAAAADASDYRALQEEAGAERPITSDSLVASRSFGSFMKPSSPAPAEPNNGPESSSPRPGGGGEDKV